MPLRAVPRPSDDPDLPLVRALRAGDPGASGALASRFERPLRAFLGRLVDDPGLVDELTQDVLVAVWRGAGGFDGRSRVSTWVFSIAHKRAVSALRRRRVATEPLDETLPAAPAALGDDALRSALAALPRAQRAVLELTLMFGFSYPEIAEILDIPVGTVKSRASAARTALRAALDREEPQP